jgi:hypothetical protein
VMTSPEVECDVNCWHKLGTLTPVFLKCYPFGHLTQDLSAKTIRGAMEVYYLLFG